jgi:quercetin dioxygenase-like cupin family protein
MTVIAAADAPTFDLGDTHVVGLASPSRGSTTTSAWRLTLDAKATSPKHSLSREEIIVALEGRLQAVYTDRVEEVAAGGALIVPAGLEFTLVNPGDEPFHGVAMLPVGGHATVDGERVDPPWAI